jgi:hypothetical protein
MITIEREGKAPIVINPPTDPELARLWDLARVKVAARSKALDWREVTREYNALTTKPHGALSQIIRERCEKAPGYD